MLCLNKRATSLNKKKTKKIITSKYSRSRQDKIGDILVIFSRRLIVRIGYKCSDSFSASKDKTKWRYLVLSIIALVFSAASALDTEWRSLVESVIAVALLCIEHKLEDEDLIKKYKPPNDEIPISKQDFRTPGRIKFLLYIFIALFGFLVFVCSCFKDGWVISLMLFVIQLIDTVISALVVCFDAEPQIL